MTADASAPVEIDISESTEMAEKARIRAAAQVVDAENLKNSFMPSGTSKEDGAGFLSTWLMMYMNQILRTGNKHTLLQVDLGPINFDDKCDNIQINFDKFWALEQKKPAARQSLWLVLWRTVGWGKIFLAMFYYLMYAGISFGPILILNALVQHVQKTLILSTGVLWFLVAMIFALPMSGITLNSTTQIQLVHII